MLLYFANRLLWQDLYLCTMSAPIQIFHADRFKILRHGVKMMLDRHSTRFTLIGDADTFASLYHQLRLREPAILIISHKLLDGFTIDHIESIREKYPRLKIVIFTMVCGVETLLKFVGKVDGFIGKAANEEEFNTAISEVAEGNPYITVSQY